MRISIIVPCYNEQAVLKLFYVEIVKVLEKITNNYELLFVDDGSQDSTLSIIKTLCINNSHIKYIAFSRNFGKEAAMYAGFCNVDADYVAVMDADMQDPPSLLPEMIQILESGKYDSVATRRKNREGEPPIRSWFARKFYQLINKISDADIVDGARDFRLMKRKMVDAILRDAEYNRFTKGIYSWVGFHTKWIAFENVERSAGETKWSFWKLFLYSIEGILAYSTAPLAIASVFGIVFCGVSFISMLVIIIRALAFGDPVAGWPSLVTIIFFLGGIQLLCLGIIGLYLSKTYLETKKRPIYIVRESE